MSNLLIGLLGALLLSDQQPVAVTNHVNSTTGLVTKATEPDDPVEKQYQKLMADDDKAQGEVDEWIRENNAFAEKGSGVPKEVLNDRIRLRFAPIRKAYDDFLKEHPDHAKAHIAYGSFLNDIREEDAALVEWEKAREIDPKNPASWNNLANHFGHDGPVKKAFEYYEKAIELDPKEAVYYHNLGTTVFLFRKDAEEYYKIDEQQVFNKALELYAKSLKYDPENFVLAQDVAQTYYGIKPVRTEEALNAWTNALKIATTPEEREGVYIHLARFKLHAERFDEARKQLTGVTLEHYAELKKLLTKNINLQEAAAREKATNAPAATLSEEKTATKPADKPPAIPKP